MNPTILLQGEKHTFSVPEGLSELLADIAREVMRAQPTQILPFICDYLTALIITRDAAKNAIKIVDETFDNELMKYSVHLKSSPDKVLWAVRVIQKALRRYLTKKRARDLRMGQLGFKRADKDSDLANIPEEKVDMSSFLKARKITYLQGHYASITIQKAWRGYWARKILRSAHSTLREMMPFDGSKLETEKYAPGWANMWLEIFETPEPTVTPFQKGKVYPVKSPSQVILPRRDVQVNRHRIQPLFAEGEEENTFGLSGSQRSTPAASMMAVDHNLDDDDTEITGEYQDQFEGEGIASLSQSSKSLLQDEPSNDFQMTPIAELDVGSDLKSKSSSAVSSSKKRGGSSRSSLVQAASGKSIPILATESASSVQQSRPSSRASLKIAEGGESFKNVKLTSGSNSKLSLKKSEGSPESTKSATGSKKSLVFADASKTSLKATVPSPDEEESALVSQMSNETQEVLTSRSSTAKTGTFEEDSEITETLTETDYEELESDGVDGGIE
ncbi:Hypothetical protein NTJ_05826 [Nesidiocoris tenuis]|uniref:RIIa domain-containing protein n=1 Tax=Nesidiocoris tenuis TaxID=355587 RepID=A0ABN7ANZ9_9HEMI|nr:Hypothetical protein NTJ_05826 [Nesidiocoris tenuis]